MSAESPQKYGTIVTEAGLRLMANAITTNTKVDIAYVALGDANGVEYIPYEGQEELKNQVYQDEVYSVEIDPDNPNWIVIDLAVPTDVGGWTVREAAVKTSDGVAIMLATCPPYTKPTLKEGTASEIHYRFYMEVTNADTVVLKINPSLVMASKEFVVVAVNNHARQTNVHGGTYEAVPQRLMFRNDDARCQVNDPVEDLDATPKRWVEAVIEKLRKSLGDLESGIGNFVLKATAPLSITKGGVVGDNPTISIAAATTAALGVVKRATDDMVIAGADKECYVTPNQVNVHTTGVGAVVYFAMNATPVNYLYCNGAAVNRTTYAALFAKLGTTYGVGDGSTTFSLPDLRGVFIRGWDNGKNYDTGRAFGSYQADADQRLTGWFSVEVHDGHLTEVSGVFPSKDAIPRKTNADWDGSAATRVNFDSENQVRTAAETRPKNVALRPCIRYR